MTSTFAVLAIDAHDPRAVADFWCSVLGWHVLEEADGTKSYWALAHPDADKPDFHDAVCFAARLA